MWIGDAPMGRSGPSRGAIRPLRHLCISGGERPGDVEHSERASHPFVENAALLHPFPHRVWGRGHPCVSSPRSDWTVERKSGSSSSWSSTFRIEWMTVE